MVKGSIVKWQRFLVGLVGVFSIAGCSSMKLESKALSSPEFDFVSYFSGHVKASGWFSDRFGNVRRHFCGDFFGSDVDGKFNLDETLYYVDGIVEKRVWLVTIGEDKSFSAIGSSLVGEVSGQLKGNTLHMEYAMNVQIEEDKEWLLSMDDWMFYQPDGSLHNVTNVSRWGIRIGTVSTQYQRHDGDLICKPDNAS